MDIKELVNAFNLNNYFSDKINTNFTVESKKIVGLFASNTDTKEYLRGIGEEIIKRQYLGGSEVARKYYNLNYFPFVNSWKEKYIDENVKKVKLTDSTNNEVICNLKVHFANEFKRAVEAKVVACLQKEVGITEEEAYEWINETVGTGAIGRPDLYCIAFSNEYLEREYDLETFEFFKQAYIKEFNSRLENCGLKSSDFYKYKDDMLYVKNVSDKVIKSVTEYVKKEVAFDFRTPGTEDSKVENFKDVLGDFIFKWTGKSINAYEYDIFTDKKTIEKGNNFVLIPLTKRYSGQLESLKHKDAYKVNIIHKDFVSDIRGMTAKPDVASCENPVYAISNKGIALLFPEIMESPISYNQINGRFEFAVDLENFKRRGSSQFSSTVTSPFNSPTHAEPPRTPPKQRKADTDSGYDSNSPPKPKDSGSSSGGPGPSTELSDMEWESPTRSQDGALEDSPRRGSEQGSETEKEGRLLHNHVNSAGTSKGSWSSTQLSFPTVSQGVPGPSKGGNLGAAAASGSIPGSSLWSQSGASSSKGANPVGTNPWAQQTNPCLSQGTSENKWISSMQFTKPGPSGLSWSQSGASSSKDANKGMSTWTSQPMNHWSSPASSAGLWSLSQSGASSSRGAGKNMLTGSSSWCLPPSTSSLTTRNDSISSNLGIFADPPEDTENICSMKEKQQVTDESDRKSSDEYSEAQSQESESPKKHGGGPLCSNSSIGSMWSKLKGNVLPSLGRNNRERSSVCSISSSVSAPVTPVTEELPLSTRSPSLPIEIVKSRSLKVTPVTEVHTENKPTELNDSITELPSQGTVGKLNMPGDRSSKISVDSGLGSLERGQSTPLTEEFSDSSQQDLSIGVKLGNMLSELLNSAQNLLKNPASSTHRGVPGGPKRQASLTSSQRQELRKVLSPEMRKKLDANFFPPGYEKLLHLLYVDSEGLCSLLSSPEAKEQVCSVLPPEEKEQVQSGSPEEIVRLLHKFFSNQKISDNCLLSSKIDFPKIKKLLQEEIFV
ncbi:hypothetical protein [Wolbachia endosymbiont (group A) of Bibio marci]|uniref:hypothetical protein n=1 Tax=Wolbachia endosymbiont (group A) of Bibio marci TaxID=2953987 RepID=UPI00222E479D|nr:hypothetical protein [Wolbachia endosymbiont (group A) of Bibio marci]